MLRREVFITSVTWSSSVRLDFTTALLR